MLAYSPLPCFPSGQQSPQLQTLHCTELAHEHLSCQQVFDNQAEALLSTGISLCGLAWPGVTLHSLQLFFVRLTVEPSTRNAKVESA